MQSMVCNVILCFVTLLMLHPKSYVTGLLRKRAQRAGRRPYARALEHYRQWVHQRLTFMLANSKFPQLNGPMIRTGDGFCLTRSTQQKGQRGKCAFIDAPNPASLS